MRISIGNNTVDVDVAATKAAYAKFSIPGPEECGCSYCRNWVSQRTKTYPAAVKNLLQRMGIKAGYETEIWEVPSEDNRHYYSGWYPFIGEIIEKSESRETIDGMEVWVSEGLSYNVPWMPVGKTQELHFSVVIDWVLDEPPDAEPDASTDV